MKQSSFSLFNCEGELVYEGVDPSVFITENETLNFCPNEAYPMESPAYENGPLQIWIETQYPESIEDTNLIRYCYIVDYDGANEISFSDLFADENLALDAAIEYCKSRQILFEIE